MRTKSASYLTDVAKGNLAIYMKSTRMNRVKVGVPRSKSTSNMVSNLQRLKTQADVVSMHDVSQSALADDM
jgi:hypothetical protein